MSPGSQINRRGLLATDVIFAWLTGLAWLALLITAHRIFLIVRDKRRRNAATGPAGMERPL
jgi:hypothetical protein